MGLLDDIIVMALKAVLERERQNKTMMEESLSAFLVEFQEKVREHKMLMREKQDMVAEEAAKEKLVADFMVFIEAIENDDPEIARKFNEKAMMENILSMMKSDAGDCVPKIIQDLEEKAKVDAIMATTNSDGSFGRDKGGIGNAPTNAKDLGKEASRMGGTQGTNSHSGGDGEDAAGCGGSCNGNCR
ncbi:hypothetical protein PTKIN_Ptkin06aG0165900 [Pterospermum kingtungense]